MNAKKAINYWLISAKDDLDTAEKLFQGKRYHHCLFFCHLFIEKTLKAAVVQKTGQHALPIHNLVKLSSDAGLKISEKRQEEFREISEFNIRARYNDFKRRFYKKATKEFTEKWFQKAKEIYLWIKKEL